MPSWQSKFFVFMLRYRHLLRFKRKRAGLVDWNTSIPALREEIEKSSGFFGRLPKELKKSPLDIDGLYAEWISPLAPKNQRVILYFHGGGYAIGSVAAHRGITAKFVKESGLPALLFDYRLAPEHPFPAALEDSLKAYRRLLEERYLPQEIFFIGDSAGGGLALAALLAIRDRGMPLPGGAVALSPWTDLKNTGESFISNAKLDNLSWPLAQHIFSSYYTNGQDAINPWISPLYGDLQGLPPLLLFAGGDELLRDDAVRFARKAEAAGVNTTLRVGEGLFHCYPACHPLFPEAREAMKEICAFLRRGPLT